MHSVYLGFIRCHLQHAVAYIFHPSTVNIDSGVKVPANETRPQLLFPHCALQLNTNDMRICVDRDAGDGRRRSANERAGNGCGWVGDLGIRSVSLERDSASIVFSGIPQDGMLEDLI